MKARHLLIAAAMFLPLGAAAQDAVHGVDGYYNYTPVQMKASGQFGYDTNNGWKQKDIRVPELRYTDDMEYAIFNLGINTTSQGELGTWGFRSGLVLQETSAGDGCMQITSAYPVIAIKLSMPVNNEAWKEGGDFGYFEPQFSWYNPESEDDSGVNPGQTNGNKNKLQLSGLDNNGRYRMVHYHSVEKDIFGRDSTYLNNNAGAAELADDYMYKTRTSGDNLIWKILRLNPTGVNASEKADFIIAMDLSTIKNGDGTPYVDLAPVKMKDISLSFLGVNASADGKTADEMPLVYIKWLKTFASMDALEESLCDEQNWGDGPAVDPNKAVLNSELYALRQLINNYQFSDQKQILQDAYDIAAGVYNAAESTSDAYVAQVEAIATAKQQFLAAIVYDNSESKMSTFYNLAGMGLGLTSQDATVGNYTGKALTLVSAENASNFLLTKSGEVAGQACYTVQTGAFSMVQANDGQLLFVPATQLSSSSARANLVLSNRKTADDPGYDFKVGNYYYYYSEEDGEFTFSQEFPSVEDVSELTNYLFYPQAASPYDKADHNEETHPMTSGEGSWNEFNGEVDVVINPAYEYSFKVYDWDADVKATAMERAKQNQFEGWRTNGWRLGTDIQAVTLATGEKTMKLTWKDTYDQIHNDTVNVDMAVTDWSATGNVLTIMREHGAYNSAANKAPTNNQQCDSLWAINMNAGINRYFAIKWKGNTDDICFNGLTFFVRKGIEEPGVGMSTLVEKRGDVYIWDLLDCGIPYDDRKACAQYMSWGGITSSADAVYVDWMRFYETIDEIPEESMAVPAPTGIRVVSNAGDDKVSFYDLNGRYLGNRRPVCPGIYVMKNGQKTLKVVVK